MNELRVFRDSKLVKNLLDRLKKYNGEEITIMEVCGTHTNTIVKSGLKDLLPEKIKLISGPGCPVCVTPQSFIDYGIELSKRDDVIITTFGDLIKVPGNSSTLQKERALGRDIRVVYSPLDSIKIAEENENKEVVFLAVGFETTAPIIALAIKNANEKKINNFSVLNGLKTMPNAMKALILDKEINIDGFLCPGHVATIIGCEEFIKMAEEHKLPMIVTGFDSSDIVYSISRIAELKNSNINFDNTYSRLVKKEGNKKAKEVLQEVFEESESEWRGLGIIDKTGLKLKEKFKQFNIKEKINISIKKVEANNGCVCGDILRGVKEPKECILFRKICNPNTPMGPCMVSEEGACSSYYKYY